MKHAHYRDCPALPQLPNPQAAVDPFFPLQKAKLLGLAIWATVVALQALVFWTSEHALTSMLMLGGGTFGILYTANRGRLTRTPISTTIIAGYTAYYFILPPVATFLELRPVVSNLASPVAVQVHAVVGLSALVMSHWAYARAPVLQRLRTAITERVGVPLRMFAPATNQQVVLIGLIGLAAMAYQIFVAGAAQQDALGADNKLMQALYPLAYVPFCMLIPALTPANASSRRKWLLVLGGYFCLLLIVAMARNTRASFLIGIMSIAMCFSFGIAAGLIPAAALRARRLLGIAIVAAAALGPISDLATSMVIVREQRAEIDPFQLLEATAHTFSDKEAIEARRADDAEREREWDERYTENLFLARLSNLKFTDNSLALVERMDAGDIEYFRALEYGKVLSILPRPILAVVAPEVDKDFVGGSSGGDLMLYTVSHKWSVLGGFRTGSLLGSSFALFGWLYPIVIAVSVIPVFLLADSQVRTISRDGREQLIFSPMAAAGFFTWFFYATSAATGVESFSALFEFPAREWLQLALIYFFAHAVTAALPALRTTR
jgi:hypothetical protein